MIEMRKLQKLGKVELLELVQELTMELDELQARLDQQPQSQERLAPEQPEEEEAPAAQPAENMRDARAYREPVSQETVRPQASQPGYFARSAQEIYQIAQRTQQEMDAYMARVRDSAKQREEEAQEIAQKALVRADEIMDALRVYQRESEETLRVMMQSVADLQQSMHDEMESARSEYGQICHLIDQTTSMRGGSF